MTNEYKELSNKLDELHNNIKAVTDNLESLVNKAQSIERQKNLMINEQVSKEMEKEVEQQHWSTPTDHDNALNVADRYFLKINKRIKGD